MDHINGELKFRKCPFCDNHFTMKNKDFKRSVKILLNISKKEKDVLNLLLIIKTACK